MYRFWRLDIKANSVHSSKFSNPRTSSLNKSLTAWVQIAIAYGILFAFAPTSLAYQQVYQYLGIHLNTFLLGF
ncbi:hypothetical protein [Nostoc sp. LEGE 12450]|uniref:hypothetical protein n=1 Tax=Nostoc sp. LEGE 12450 TaxID=1828643 RepID=UPI0018817887|nr:hypothetical protein [Nostoc sp. LEGE 12450]MBE8986186.1 hypothetical protein [Nostoc sp. LEGE 12450]